ncbi:MFS transporter [Caulobacter soli]|uniref:MFS transporter n=1 Tax=Caulobacter soli TaxID=2708539 RepID=UPI0013EAEBCB|nr:MFS transporter [Caulobacter soli]
MTDLLATPAEPVRRDWRIFFLCFAVAMIDGFDTLLISFIAPTLSGDWNLSDGQLGRLFTAGLIGAAGGAFGSGLMADRFGRKPVLVGCVVLFSLASLACALAQSPATLLALRVIGGLGLGGAIPAIAAMTAETTPAARRSAAVTQMFIGFPAGAVLGGTISAWLVDAEGWRAAFVLGGVLPALLVPVLMRLREPASWTARHAVPERAGGLRDGLAAASLLLWTTAFCVLLLGYFLVSWTPMMLARTGLADSHAALGAVVLNLGGVAGAIVISQAFRRFGAFTPVALALGLGAGLVVLLGRLLHVPALGFGLIFLTGAMVIGAQLNLPTMAAALYPVASRATGVGSTMAVGRIGSIIGPAAGGLLLGLEMERSSLFLIVALPAIAGGLALLMLARFKPRATPA